MNQILNLVPYEVRINAINLSSGKNISNTLYFKDFVDHGGGYAAPIPGVGNADTDLEQSAYIQWAVGANSVLTALSDEYQMVSIRVRSITGRAWKTPVVPIAGIAASLVDTHVITGGPHGLVAGDAVNISSVTVPSTINGQHTVVSVISAVEYTIGGVFTGVYSGAGTQQKISGNQSLTYGSNLEVAHNDVGAIGSDQMPLHTTISMRRLNAGVGKNWRSRLSISPLTEGDQKNGRLTVAALAIWTTVGTTLATPLTLPGIVVETPVALSMRLAMLEPTPFAFSNAWVSEVNAFVPRTNLGSLVKRKPRLTSAITP